MNTLEIPSFIPARPNPPKGYHWEYRGRGWCARKVIYIFFDGLYASEFDNVSNALNLITSNTNACKHVHYFELVKDAPKANTVNIIVRTFEEWKSSMVQKLKEDAASGKISIGDLLDAPKLDPENLGPFCDHYIFADVYETNVLVSLPSCSTTFWYITNGDAVLVPYPKTS